MNYLFELETLWLKYTRGSKQETWFTSDLHFFHANVINYCKRPFKNVMEMNEALVRRWNAQVLPKDTVYCLGDFSMNSNRMRDVAPRLNGFKNLIPGNHDEIFWSKKKLQKYIDAGWNVCPNVMDIYVDRYLVKLSHLPYADEQAKKYDVRYLELRPSPGPEDFLLHGHLHVKYVKNGNCIDVGIDHNFRLYSRKDILKLMEGPTFIKSRLDDVKPIHGEAM